MKSLEFPLTGKTLPGKCDVHVSSSVLASVTNYKLSFGRVAQSSLEHKDGASEVTERCLTPNLIPCVQDPGLTWWKDSTNSHRVSTGLHRYTKACTPS